MESRLRIANGLLIALFAIVALRLFQLQVVQGGRYYRLSEQNRIRKFVTPAPRGKVLDRNGVVLADNRPSFSVLLVPAEADSAGIELLAGILGMPAEEVWSRLGRSESGLTPVRLRRGADPGLVAMVEENSSRIPGVVVRSEPQRFYPFGRTFAHVLGYVNEVTDQDLARDTSYRPGSIRGVAGLEVRYESVLRGRDGTRYVVVNAWGREVGTLPERPESLPEPGRELHLTLDANLQQCAVRLLEPYRKGVIVGLSLRDGGVLCMVSKPDFDPNLLSGVVPHDIWQSLVSDKETPFVNRAVMSVYNPGSTIKPVTALAALRRGVVTERSLFQPCTGVFEYGRGRFRCSDRHGRLDLVPAIVHSCNVYFYQLGLKVGIDPLAAALTDYGFGQTTGIDLANERAGIAPTRAWLDRRYGKDHWTIGVVLNLAIGQGELQVTPLQLALFYALLAGNGERYAPHLLDFVGDGRDSVDRPALARSRTDIDPEHLSIVRQALTGVVERGTGGAAQVPGIKVAGKTGTAERTGSEDHAWFACYAGRSSPEVVFVVLLENAGKGGAKAAPVARELVKEYFGIREPVPAAAEDTTARRAGRARAKTGRVR